VLVYSVIGFALVATAIQSWVTVQRVTVQVAAGQGRRLLHVLGRDLHRGRPVTVELLERLLRLHEGLGLRCIAAPGERPGAPIAVGDCRLRANELDRLLAQFPPGSILDLGRTAAMVGAPPPWRRPARVGSADRRAVLIVFEPMEANALQGSVTRSLIVALAAVVALVAATILLWRLSRRAEQLQEAAERDRRLVTLGEMSAVLAHEIRNPLAALKGHAQLLAEQLAATGSGHDKAERVVTEARRLERLTEDLLSFLRANRVSPAPVDPALVLREAGKAVGPARIEIDARDAPATWSLDAARMHQALVNLLRNALEASPDGAPARATVGRAGASLLFCIRDRGQGLPAGDPGRVFEAFYTTRTQGTGLGLAVARRIVELHGGSISARTHPEGGAEFRVVIP
jgi:two-component system sensor histidine kinase HydH